ncbi:MAG: DUF4173 domain-containing protein [Bacteroidetes bacterium]|nr:DUF4173 domain-containing protein [Bacteroidota bacterium]
MKTKLIFIALGGLLFNYLFWMQDLGLNLVLFSWFVIGSSLFFFHPKNWNEKLVVALTAHLFSTICLLVVNSNYSIFFTIITWMMATGILHQKTIRTPFIALLQSIQSFFYFPVRQLPFSNTKLMNRFWKLIDVVYKWKVMVVLLLVFTFLFFLANVPFQRWMISILEYLADFLTWLFEDLSLIRFFIIVFGSWLCTWAFFKSSKQRFLTWEENQNSQLERVKSNVFQRKTLSFSTTVLREKMKVFTITFFFLNVLLLAINYLDIKYIWMGFDFKSDVNFSRQVHEGVYVLITSIVLSATIIGVVFHGNLNFIRNNKRLKQTAIAWIIQNMFLLISVGLRNQYYIDSLGLTYKRIGVFMFLLAVLCVLIFLAIKVLYTKSLFYMAQTVSISIFCILITSSAINWDKSIFRFNTSSKSKNQVDMYYLLSLSDEIQVDVYKFMSKPHSLENYTEKQIWNLLLRSNRKIVQIQTKLDHRTWQSFNFRIERMATQLDELGRK